MFEKHHVFGSESLARVEALIMSIHAETGAQKSLFKGKDAKVNTHSIHPFLSSTIQATKQR